MAEKDKKFYWIKLKTEFMEGKIVDFLMSQKNGANYVVLYQMLCVKTINTKGELATKIGELIVPFDIEKIQRDLKWFDIDTVRVALELYKKLGLVYLQEDGILTIANFEEMVGSETYWARIKRKERDVGNELENVQQPLISNISYLISNIFNYWNDKNIIKHREITEDISKAIEKALKLYSEEEIKTYIDRYAKLISDKDYFWHYKWSLKDFLTRKEGIPSFTDEGSKWVNYCAFLNDPKKTANTYGAKFLSSNDYNHDFEDDSAKLNALFDSWEEK
ncbi:MAG: phage replisome organizer N-terminal domain-containing protein [Prevotella sp.]|nr:phage replisome organizer N-terminal domain-containing protein [Prevotella sp.]